MLHRRVFSGEVNRTTPHTHALGSATAWSTEPTVTAASTAVCKSVSLWACHVMVRQSLPSLFLVILIEVCNTVPSSFHNNTNHISHVSGVSIELLFLIFPQVFFGLKSNDFAGHSKFTCQCFYNSSQIWHNAPYNCHLEIYYASLLFFLDTKHKKQSAIDFMHFMQVTFIQVHVMFRSKSRSHCNSVHSEAAWDHVLFWSTPECDCCVLLTYIKNRTEGKNAPSFHWNRQNICTVKETQWQPYWRM